MLLRRIAGSLLTLLTLHLNVLGVDVACAKHGAHEGENDSPVAMLMTDTGSAHTPITVQQNSASRADPAPASHGGSHVSQRAAGNEQPPCDLPLQPNCCKALTSCSTVFSPGSALSVASVSRLQILNVPTAMNAPPSERAAPEPPPPKA